MAGLFPIQSVTVPMIWANYFTTSPPQYQTISTSTLLDRIVSLGANDVRLTPSLGVLSSYSDSSYDPAPQQTLESIRTFTDAAKARGLTITWLPFSSIDGVITGDPTQPSHPEPSDPAAWFASFRDVVLEHARVAQAIGAARYSVMTDAEQFIFQKNPQLTTSMVNLIAEVKTIFSGQVTSAIHTSTGTVESVPMSILKALDMVGLGFFPNLTTKTDPTLAELQAALHSDIHGVDVIGNLKQFAADIGKPLWIADFAQSSYDGWLRNNPDKFATSAIYVVDDSEQVLGYQSIFTELAKYGFPWLQGISAQNISRIENANGLVHPFLVSPIGENYWGKPAQQVLTGFYTGSTSTPELVLAGTKYGEALQGGFGPSTLTANPATRQVAGGPAADTIVSNVSGQASAQELRLKVSGLEAHGVMPSFTLKVNGAYVPLDFKVTTAAGSPAPTLSIPIFEAGKINTIEIVATNCSSAGPAPG